MSDVGRIRISWSAALWLLAGAILLISALLYFRLDASVKELTQKRAELESRIDLLSYERDQMVSSQVLLLTNSRGLAYQLEQQFSLLEEGCLVEYRIRCEFWRSLGGLYVNLRSAVEGRITSKTTADFVALEADYKAIAEQARAIEWRGDGESDRWEAIALEGIAYSRLRQEDFEAAEELARRAIALYPSSGIVNSTLLKARCASDSNPAELQDIYSSFLDSLDNQINAELSAGERRTLEFNKNLFESDPEIRKYCDGKLALI